MFFFYYLYARKTKQASIDLINIFLRLNMFEEKRNMTQLPYSIHFLRKTYIFRKIYTKLLSLNISELAKLTLTIAA
jgi:hypothetical protein